MPELTEDNVKVIMQEQIIELSDKIVFRENCKERHEKLEVERVERGQTLTKLDDSLDLLSKSVNGKFNKIYLTAVVIMASTITTLVVAIISLLSR